MSNIFSLFLTSITLITGIMWCYEYYKMYKKKIKIKNYIKKKESENTDNQIIYKPSWFNTFSSFFPVLFIVLIIRSFLYEPFQIPSGSMIPTLLVGDFILVEKFSYNLKNPITQKTVFNIGQPKRGDIAVFKYPKDPNINFVKRVIGIPGDKIIYNPEEKELYIYPNCLISSCIQSLPVIYSLPKKSEWVLFFNTHSSIEHQQGTYQLPLKHPIPINALRQIQKNEKIGDSNHIILTMKEVYTKSCYQQPGMAENEWIIPPKHYFMMGDNRDNSADSRMWGFVPEDNFIGRVIFIWFGLDKNEGEWPTGIRLNRIGTLNK